MICFVAANGRVEQDDEIEGIMEAEMLCEEELQMNEVWARGNMESVFKCAGEKQLSSLVKWAKNIPHFTELAIHDQVLSRQK